MITGPVLGGVSFYKKYGHPKKNESKFMTIWDVPPHLEMGIIPKKIYCNKDIIAPLEAAFTNLCTRWEVRGGKKFYYWQELKSWDGCHNFRPVRGYEERYRELMSKGREELAIRLLSVHSWGDAIDVNASENGIGVKPKLSPGFVKCFTDAGFHWGGDFKRLDGMHFQLAKI